VTFVIRGRVRRAAARAIDAVIGALVRTRDAPAVSVPTAPRVLVIRCDHIGDAVMATSVLGPLRAALQPETLDVLAGPWAEPVFTSHPAVDRVLTYATPWWSVERGASFVERVRGWAALPGFVRELRRGRYDIGIDLRGDLRQIVFFLHAAKMPIRVSSNRTGGADLLTHVWHNDERLHEVQKDFAIAALLGAEGQPSLAVHSPPHASHELVQFLSPKIRTRGYAVMALRGSSENRQWPAEHAASVVDGLSAEFGLPCVTVGGPADVPLSEAVERLASAPVHGLAGRIPLGDSMEVIRHARLVIAVDSGPMHLAAAAGVPLVALFGPGDPQACGPWSDRAEVVASSAPCGCRRSRCEFVEDAGRCMRLVTPAMVLDAARRVLT
jgi:heptosyltransferase-2